MRGGKLVSTIVFSLALAVVTAGEARTHATGMVRGTNGWQGRPESSQGSITPEEQARLSKQALAHLRKSPAVKRQRLRVLSIKSLPNEDEKVTPQKSRATVVVFNYSTGKATRLTMDRSNDLVLREERLPGRPQPSEEEREEARQVVRADSELGRMLAGGSVLEGGFVVDAPEGQSLRHRFIQFQILTSDRLSLERLVIVNLTSGSIAESKQQYPGKQ